MNMKKKLLLNDTSHNCSIWTQLLLRKCTVIPPSMSLSLFPMTNLDIRLGPELLGWRSEKVPHKFHHRTFFPCLNIHKFDFWKYQMNYLVTDLFLLHYLYVVSIWLTLFEELKPGQSGNGQLATSYNSCAATVQQSWHNSYVEIDNEN